MQGLGFGVWGLGFRVWGLGHSLRVGVSENRGGFFCGVPLRGFFSIWGDKKGTPYTFRLQGLGA